MARRLLLLHSSHARYGGHVSYTLHLARAAQGLGLDVQIVRPRAKTRGTPREYAQGWEIVGMPLGEILRELLSPETRGLVTAVSRNEAGRAALLVAGGAGLVVHDPTEMKGNSPLLAVHAAARPLVAVRRAGHENLLGRGHGHARWHRHPYAVPPTDADHPWAERSGAAACWARIDWDKRTELILDHNDRRPDLRVDLYGALNGRYAWARLDSYVGWREAWFGAPPPGWRPEAEAQAYRFAVDMSVIAGDGGGTQYTHLEAWAAGCVLVLHEGWIRPDDDLVPGYNCLAVADGRGLGEALDKTTEADAERLRAGGYESLERHRTAGAELVSTLWE